jgi:hypothetical protein
LEQQTDADAAIAGLTHQGFGRDHLHSFSVNPPGQQAQLRWRSRGVVRRSHGGE